MTSTISWTRKGKNFNYIFTSSDREILIRAIAFEGEPQRAVAWTLIQRFAWIWPTYQNFAEFVKAYVQPINPRWFPDGDLHAKRINRLRGKQAEIILAIERAERRTEFAQTPILDLHIKYHEIVDAIIEGKDKSPCPSAVHYSMSLARINETEVQAREHATRVGAQRRMGPAIDSGAGFRQRVNWFFAAGGSHRTQMKISIIPADGPNA